MTPEQRQYLARMLRETADFIDIAVSEPELIGGLVWEAMQAVERQAYRPPAA